MVDIKNIPVKLKNDCRFCVWKFEKRCGQKTKMPYNPASSERAKINDLRTFADFKTTLMAYAMGGFDGIGIAVGNGIGAFDIDHCIREDGTLNDTAATVLSIFPTAYVEKSPSGKGQHCHVRVRLAVVKLLPVTGIQLFELITVAGFLCVCNDRVIAQVRVVAQLIVLHLLVSLHQRIQQRGHGFRVVGDLACAVNISRHGDEAVCRTGHIHFKPFAPIVDVIDRLVKNIIFRHTEEAALSILAFWCGCDEEQMDRIFRTSGLMRDKWDRKQAGTTYGAISIRNAVNTATSVYVPVNAQDIVDEEFSNLDPEAKNTEYQPDISKFDAVAGGDGSTHEPSLWQRRNRHGQHVRRFL